VFAFILIKKYKDRVAEEQKHISRAVSASYTGAPAYPQLQAPAQRRVHFAPQPPSQQKGK
jgi:hypothetical protein